LVGKEKDMHRAKGPVPAAAVIFFSFLEFIFFIGIRLFPTFANLWFREHGKG
jgi:hypothetical protein